MLQIITKSVITACLCPQAKREKQSRKRVAEFIICLQSDENWAK